MNKKKFLVQQKSSKNFFLNGVESVKAKHHKFLIFHLQQAQEEDEEIFLHPRKKFFFLFSDFCSLPVLQLKDPGDEKNIQKFFPLSFSVLQGELCIYDVSYGSCKCFHA